MLIAGTGRRSVHNRTLVSGVRAHLTRLLRFPDNTVADYQPGNFTGTLNASAWLNSIGVAGSLLQASGAAQPAIQADGSLLFDGIAMFMKSLSFTLKQPITDYIVFKQISWTAGDYIFDGDTIGSYLLYQQGTTPGIRFNAGAEPFENTGLVVGSYGIVTTVGNGASGSLKVNNNAAQSGNFGASNADGSTLGGRADGTALSNIQVKEWIRRAGADSAATQAQIVNLLNAIHGVF